ncbi:hypothetical protein M3P05_04625 [Sansalvadorimonas sp. 2012CJ34-2]|uniref:Uncharacterized protein n=1 Tax=Parendozoicomonas callyspongiae TaxID=2942213 RepID=A0ABT0PCX5_9GAMM|nr:hypothetical protein [Sansalvadorimonas sp. 2012CJ34-2]MCL6269229.1 hypothetical protein [Sansalvadorimonas sp. 2012CJ34-2]
MRPRYPALLSLVFAAVLLPLPGYASVLLEEANFSPSSADTQSDTSTSDSKGVPIFRFNDNSWFELTIPKTKHPETGKEIEAERNRENAIKNSDREPLFDENLDFLNQLQLRYRIKFK